jgi:hypothetical protein
MIEKQDFVLYTGKSKTIRVPVTDTDGLPFDFTGWAVKWNLRKTDANGELVVSKLTDQGITFDATYLYIELNVEDTDTLLTGKYYHELSAYKSGKEYDICNGTVTLKKSGN